MTLFVSLATYQVYVKVSTGTSIPQMYKGDPRTYTIFIPARGSNWGYSDFPHQNNHGSSGAYVLRSERENKHGA